jgi:hypothetical protein
MAIVIVLLGINLAPTAHAASPRHKPHYGIGTWNYTCITYREGTDESVTFASDDTWANHTCNWWLSHQYDTWTTVRCAYGNCDGDDYRPGNVHLALIYRYTGVWRDITNLIPDIGVGSAWVAVRDTAYNNYSN